MSNETLYAITGATGNIGKRVAEALLDEGKRVRGIGRSEERLRDLVARGAEGRVASLGDPSATRAAFEGAGAVFSMIPLNLGAEDYRAFQAQVSEAQVEAMRAAGVQHVVTLSSVGGHLTEGTGPILGLHFHEERVNALSEVHALHLRPTFFMENLFFQVDTIKQMGVAGSPLRPDLSIGMIATRDIAQVAAEALSGLAFTGHSTRELLGQRDLSMQEATAILGKAIGREDLAYVQFPYEDAEQAMVGAGMSPSVAGLMIEMYRSFNEGKIRPTESRSPANTTPTPLEEWVSAFAAAFQAA